MGPFSNRSSSRYTEGRGQLKSIPHHPHQITKPPAACGNTIFSVPTLENVGKSRGCRGFPMPCLPEPIAGTVVRGKNLRWQQPHPPNVPISHVSTAQPSQGAPKAAPTLEKYRLGRKKRTPNQDLSQLPALELARRVGTMHPCSLCARAHPSSTPTHRQPPEAPFSPP